MANLTQLDIQVYSSKEADGFKQFFDLPLLRFVEDRTWRFDYAGFQEHMEARHVTEIDDLIAWTKINYADGADGILTALIAKELAHINPNNSHCAAISTGKRSVYLQRLDIKGEYSAFHRPVDGYIHWPLAITKQGYAGTSQSGLQKQTWKKWQIDHLPTGLCLVGNMLRTKKQAAALVTALWEAHTEARTYFTNLTSAPLPADTNTIAIAVKKVLIEAIEEATK